VYALISVLGGVDVDVLAGWLGHWAEQYSKYDVVSVAYYLGWYAAVVVFIVMT
jgi:hypothetical protein